jgi:hypothetical protein
MDELPVGWGIDMAEWMDCSPLFCSIVKVIGIVAEKMNRKSCVDSP